MRDYFDLQTFAPKRARLESGQSTKAREQTIHPDFTTAHQPFAFGKANGRVIRKFDAKPCCRAEHKPTGQAAEESVVAPTCLVEGGEGGLAEETKRAELKNGEREALERPATARSVPGQCCILPQNSGQAGKYREKPAL
jgi:hypothetical protein